MRKRFLPLAGAFGVAIMAASFNFGGNRASATISIPYTNSRVNLDSSGNQATGGNSESNSQTSVSADGRYVLFSSGATNLVSGDTNSLADLFVRDRLAGTTTRVNLTSSGTQTQSTPGQCIPLDRWGKISADGKFVVFVTCSKNFAPTASGYNYHVYLHNMATGTTDMIDTGLSGAMPNDTAYEMSTDISADGRYVVFGSNATNLVSNGHNGIFVRDTKLNTTTLVSDSYNGTTPNGTSDRPSISCDGSLIVFSSTASNLVSGDTNSLKDVFLVNRIGGYSIKDLTLNANAESGATYGWPLTAKVSCDGSTVLLSSKATNLASGVTGTNVHSYVYDTYDETLELIDQTTGGTLANGSVQDEAISGDGNLVVYQSPATNLDSVSSDTNSTSDIFIRDRSAGTTYRISKQNSTTELSSGGTEQSAPAISPDGRYVTYISGAANAVSGDTNNLLDVFVTPTGLTPTNY